MEVLPEEINNEILLIIDRPSLFYCSQVCKQWRQLSLKQVKITKTINDFVRSCEEGDRLSIVRSKFEQNWLNDGLYRSCQGGHKEIVELMIIKGADDWNRGLYGACRGGHKETVELMITKGADDWNYGLYYACLGGHKETVELMITKGATLCNCGKSIQTHYEIN